MLLRFTHWVQIPPLLPKPVVIETTGFSLFSMGFSVFQCKKYLAYRRNIWHFQDIFCIILLTDLLTNLQTKYNAWITGDFACDLFC
jgi:hypothetical protein